MVVRPDGSEVRPCAPVAVDEICIARSWVEAPGRYTVHFDFERKERVSYPVTIHGDELAVDITVGDRPPRVRGGARRSHRAARSARAVGRPSPHDGHLEPGRYRFVVWIAHASHYEIGFSMHERRLVTYELEVR